MRCIQHKPSLLLFLCSVSLLHSVSHVAVVAAVIEESPVDYFVLEEEEEEVKGVGASHVSAVVR